MRLRSSATAVSRSRSSCSVRCSSSSDRRTRPCIAYPTIHGVQMTSSTNGMSLSVNSSFACAMPSVTAHSAMPIDQPRDRPLALLAHPDRVEGEHEEEQRRDRGLDRDAADHGDELRAEADHERRDAALRARGRGSPPSPPKPAAASHCRCEALTPDLELHRGDEGGSDCDVADAHASPQGHARNASAPMCGMRRARRGSRLHPWVEAMSVRIDRLGGSRPIPASMWRPCDGRTFGTRPVDQTRSQR